MSATAAFTKLAFTASDRPEAQLSQARLIERYGQADEAEADAIVALGGDGFMLETLRRTMDLKRPVYGMNRGSVGFMMNDYVERNLPTRIAAAERATIHPLVMTAVGRDGVTRRAIAINEVSLLRQTAQTARLCIAVDGRQRLAELVCDGVLVATPAGSTAYNLSAHGPIIPIDGRVLALTPISAFRPRRWRGALLSHTAEVRISVLEADKRPVAAVADNVEVRDVAEVTIAEDRAISFIMLFDAGRSLDERVLTEQFSS